MFRSKTSWFHHGKKTCPSKCRHYFALALLIPFSGCKKSEEPSARPPEVKVAAVEQRDVPIYRDWVGTLEGEVNATIPRR